MVLSNKGILAILWELFPRHQNLLPTFRAAPAGSPYVMKPLFGREGDNISVVRGEQRSVTDGVYGAEGFVYQEYFELPEFDGQHPVVGSWVIDQEAAGVGIRESEGPVTRNESPFVPHVLL